MKLFSYVAALGSWTSFLVLQYLYVTRLAAGPAIYVGGSIIFFCIAAFLLVASWRKRQQSLAWVAGVLFLPWLVCGGLHHVQDIDEIGANEVPLTFVVVDAESQKPIPNALIQILDKFDEPRTVSQGQSEGRTQEDGSLSLSPSLIYTASIRSFRQSGTIRFWNKRIEIEAEGYQLLSEKLEAYSGAYARLFDFSVLPITIAMKRRQPGEND
jgi:hypothetical protein